MATVATYLKCNGFEVVEQDYQCDAGTIGYIAFDDGTLVLIEVKEEATCSDYFSDEGNDTEKLKRFEAVAIQHLNSHDVGYAPVRFDVISKLDTRHGVFLRHHKGIFSDLRTRKERKDNE